jgi:hypothetical protein
VNVITNKEVPPALIVLGEKVLDTSGALGVTVSTSEAEQTLATQPGAAFVLVMPAGVVIDAVLVT